MPDAQRQKKQEMEEERKRREEEKRAFKEAQELDALRRTFKRIIKRKRYLNCWSRYAYR